MLLLPNQFFCEDAALVPKFEDETSDWLWEDIISQNMNYSQLCISTFFNVLTSNLEDFSNIQSKLKNLWVSAKRSCRVRGRLFISVSALNWWRQTRWLSLRWSPLKELCLLCLIFLKNSRKEVLALGRVVGCFASVSLIVIFKCMTVLMLG